MHEPFPGDTCFFLTLAQIVPGWNGMEWNRIINQEGNTEESKQGEKILIFCYILALSGHDFSPKTASQVRSHKGSGILCFLSPCMGLGSTITMWLSLQLCLQRSLLPPSRSAYNPAAVRETHSQRQWEDEAWEAAPQLER